MVYLYKINSMGKYTSIILGSHFDSFIQDQIKTGKFNSASEIIRSGLRLLEVEYDKREAVKKALIIGEKSGKIKRFDNEKFKSKMRKKLNK